MEYIYCVGTSLYVMLGAVVNVKSIMHHADWIRWSDSPFRVVVSRTDISVPWTVVIFCPLRSIGDMAERASQSSVGSQFQLKWLHCSVQVFVPKTQKTGYSPVRAAHRLSSDLISSLQVRTSISEKQGG